MRIWLCSFLFVCCYSLGAQSPAGQNGKIPQHPNVTDSSGRRQGWWTIELDGDMRRSLSPAETRYYRIMEFKDDVPTGVTRDYYPNGMLYEELTLLSFTPYGPKSYSQKVDYSQPYKVYWEDGSENLIAPNRIQCENLIIQGKYELALPYAEKALAATASKLGRNNWRYAYFLKQLGTIYQTLGSYAKAEPLYIESRKITESLGEKGTAYVNSPISLAYLYYLMGNYGKAEQLFKEALNRAEQIEGKESLSYATALNNMGLIYDNMGQYRLSASHYEESIKIRERLIGRKNTILDPGYPINIHNYAYTLDRQGRYAEAEPLYLKALEIMEKQGARESFKYAQTLSFLANLNRNRRAFLKSEEQYKEVLRITEKLGFTNHPNYTYFLMNLAYLYVSENDFTRAEPYALRAKEKYMNQIETFFPSLSEFEKESYYQSIRLFFVGFNSLCLLRYEKNPAILGEMYNNQLATKALLLNNAYKWKQRIRNSGDKKLFALYTEWESNQGVLARWKKENDVARQPSIDSLDQINNVLEKELSRRSELFASLSEKKRITWQDVRSRLKAGEAAIEMIRVKKFGLVYSITDSSDSKLPRYPAYGLTDTVYYAALLITPTSKLPELVLLKNGNQLENKFINQYANAIRTETEDKDSYNQFWKPIFTKLNSMFSKNSATRIHVYFSADGVYHKLNLNTLQNPATKKYVLDETSVSLITSTKDLLAPQKEETYNNLAYLFGYPDYGATLDERNALVQKERDSQPVYYALALERGSGNLSELPGTKTEVENIAGLMTAKGWQPEVLTGGKALEETLKDCFKPRVLHIATHGYFQTDTPAHQNPLLNSGLLLAGAAQTLQGVKDDKSEDGILTAYEAMNLNLDNTDLVVLSACETGLGAELNNGEGVYGLQRAFKVAGARTVVMSLWKVNDDATQELMTAFYKHWLETQNKREAFNLAQQQLKAKYKSPYYWGAFVLTGE